MASDQSFSETPGHQVVGRGLRALGEAAIAPGSSLILDGNLASGALHIAAGTVAKSLLGPVGWLLVAANSYSKSVNGKGLMDLVGEGRSNKA